MKKMQAHNPFCTVKGRDREKQIHGHISRARTLQSCSGPKGEVLAELTSRSKVKGHTGPVMREDEGPRFYTCIFSQSFWYIGWWMQGLWLLAGHESLRQLKALGPLLDLLLLHSTGPAYAPGNSSDCVMGNVRSFLTQLLGAFFHSDTLWTSCSCSFLGPHALQFVLRWDLTFI